MPISPVELASIAAALGDRVRAFALPGGTLRERDHQLVTLLDLGITPSLRGDRLTDRIVAQVRGLPAAAQR